jgi:hypothetical protein
VTKKCTSVSDATFSFWMFSGFVGRISRHRPHAGDPRARELRCVAQREGGTALLKPAAGDVLQRWPVSKRVNSSKADADDPTLIERVALATAE